MALVPCAVTLHTLAECRCFESSQGVARQSVLCFLLSFCRLVSLAYCSSHLRMHAHSLIHAHTHGRLHSLPHLCVHTSLVSLLADASLSGHICALLNRIQSDIYSVLHKELLPKQNNARYRLLASTSAHAAKARRHSRQMQAEPQGIYRGQIWTWRLRCPCMA